jgi:hypothetical protein
MNDESLWQPYVETVQFLNKLYNRSKKRRDKPDIPCKPSFKIVEDEMVVGILTNTNQFIQISEPIHLDEINEDLDIPSITDQDYIVNPKERPMIQSDSQIITQNVVDVEREDYIKRIKLETSFYNVFRNTIRILLNSYENIKIREKIESEMVKDYIIYSLIDGVRGGIEKSIFISNKTDKSTKFIMYNAQPIEYLNINDVLLFTEKEAKKIIDEHNKIFKIFIFYYQKYEDFIIELDTNKYNI